MSEELFKRVSVIKTKLLTRCPFLGYLILHLAPVESHFVPIAGVEQDGTLLLNPETFLQMSTDEQAFVLAHEVLHPGFLFWSRLRGRDLRLFNIAHDYAINWVLSQWAEKSDVPIAVPKGVLLDRRFAEMSAEEIYEIVRQEDPGGGDGDGDGDADGEGTGNSSGKGGKGVGKEYYLSDDCRPKTGSKSKKEGLQEDREQTLSWKGRITVASNQHEQAFGWGDAPAGLQRLIKEVLFPTQDWWEILSKWFGENGPRRNYSYRRPSRRSESAGQYLPSRYKDGLPDVVKLLDTSGSMSMEDIKAGCGELAGICEDLGLSVRVIVIDTEIHSDVTIDNVHELLPHIKGGGGSDYRPAFELLRKEGFTGVVVCSTDGYISVPEERPQHLRGVLWLLTKEGQRPAKYGDVIRIDRARR